MTTAIVLRRQPKPFVAGPCFYCGRLTFRTYSQDWFPWKHTRDHVIPVSKVPKDKRKNLQFLTVPCCGACNSKKSNRMPSQKILNRAPAFVRRRSPGDKNQKWYGVESRGNSTSVQENVGSKNRIFQVTPKIRLDSHSDS